MAAAEKPAPREAKERKGEGPEAKRAPIKKIEALPAQRMERWEERWEASSRETAWEKSFCWEAGPANQREGKTDSVVEELMGNLSALKRVDEPL